jgi:hypothetical protein
VIAYAEIEDLLFLSVRPENNTDTETAEVQ